MANRWYYSLCRTFCRCYDSLNDAYGFVGDHALNAPQANVMVAIIEPMMTGGSAQWLYTWLAHYLQSSCGW